MKSIKAVALQPFPYSFDGVTELRVIKGQRFECPANLFPGLSAARMVALPPAEEIDVPAPVFAPEVAVQVAEVDDSAEPDAEIVEDPTSVDEDIVVSEEYEARDAGRGWSAIFLGDEEVEGVKKLRKDDAAAFNAMTAEDRAEYVASELSAE